MTVSTLYTALDGVNHTREKRLELANIVLINPGLILPLMEKAFDIDDPLSSRACWVLEFAAQRELSVILPYIEVFTSNIAKVHLDSSVRPVAKICELLMRAYFTKTKNEFQERLTDIHLKKISSACFDWLIGEQKVAAKAYSMTSLYLLGKKYSWIHPELRLVLEQNYANGSAAYKARARHVLAKIA